MADHELPRRKSTSLRLSTDSIPPQLPLYSSPPQPNPSWNRFDDNPPDYPESSEEADADESDQEVSIHKRRHPSPQVYVSPFQSSPRKTRRFPHQYHSQSPSLTSPRTRLYARSSALRHAATNSDTYLDSLLARSVHALEISNTLLQSSLSTQSSMNSRGSSAEDGLVEGETGLSRQITDGKDLQKGWIDDLEEIGKRIDGLFGEQTETRDGPSSGRGQESRTPVEPPDATSPVSQSLPTPSGLPQTLAERRRGHQSPPLTVVTQSSEGQLNYSAHDRSHFVAPPPRALTVYIGSDDIDPDAIKLPPTLGIRSPPQPVHPHLFQSATPPISPSLSSSRRTSFSNGHTPEMSAATRAYDILASFVTPQHTPSKIIRNLPFGSNVSPIRQRNQTSPTPSDGSRGRSLTPLRAVRMDSQSNSPILLSKPLTPPIEELSPTNSSSESDRQTNFAVTSLRKIFMDDQALAIERERQLSASRSGMCHLFSE